MNKEQTPGEVARDRLKAVLESDRGHLNGKTLELFKRDIAAVMQSYLEIEEAGMQVHFERSAGGSGRSLMTIEVPAGKLRKMPAEKR